MMDEPAQIMTRYLLGELSESEQAALEEKYFTDPQVFDQVLKTESELVDGYVRGQLSNEVRERFEKSYLKHPARRERMQFASALAARLDQEVKEPVTNSEQLASPVSWWQRVSASLRGQRLTLRFSLALATLLIMIGSVWVLIESRRQQRELAQTQAAYEAEQRRERQQSQQAADEGRRPEELAAGPGRVERSPQQIPQPKPTPIVSSTPRSVSLALTVGGVRGGDNSRIPTLIIPPGTTQARLLLNFKENDYPSYRASIQTIAGAEIFSQTGVKPGRAKTGVSFVFTVPASTLASGDYILTLRGVSPSGEIDDLSKSLFRVEKR